MMLLLTLTVKVLKLLSITFKSEFENTLTWGKENKMQVHLTKTTCMLAGTRHRVNESRPLAITS